MSTITVKINADKFLKDLKAYQVSRKAKFIQAINESGINIERAAKKNVLVDTGRLRGSIRILNRRSDRLGLEVGTDVAYAAAVEFGTKPHVIRVKNAKVLYSRKLKRAFGTEVQHPGTPAKPFLNPAAQAEKPKFEKALKRILKA